MNISTHGTMKRCKNRQWTLHLPSWIFFIFNVTLGVLQTQGQQILIAAGSSRWAYWDQGVPADAAWREPDFNEATWSTGTAPLGYGDGDEATVVDYGSDSENKHITTYFRHGFEVTNPTNYAALEIRLQRDDGAVVYLNGLEVIRDNLPAGEIAFDTQADVAVGGANETAYHPYSLEPTALRAGHNVLAVEVHQARPDSSDISFDLELVGDWIPLQVAPVSPENLAAVDSPSPPLTVAVADPIAPAASLSVTYYGREASPTPGPDFCLIALPDTQYYTGTKNGGTPELFIRQIEWILSEQAASNIVIVIQLGDCVENGDNGGDDTEWRHATNALYRLETHRTPLLHDGIPYGFAPGNHDLSGLSSGVPTSVFFNQYFGVDHFTGRSYYGGHHGTNNNNNYELFSASGLDFIIVHLEYDTTPEPALLAWANQLLQANAHRRAIVVSHYLMERGEQAPFSDQGQAVYDALKDNPNLFLMLAGHVPGEGRRQDTWNGRTVHTLLADYQMRDRGGDGWLRILEFSPSNNVVRVRTYSPVLDQYERDADSEFTLDYDMGGREGFCEVGRRNAVDSGNQASLVWSNLTPGLTYEWRVEVTDGARALTSPVWRFTVGQDPGATSVWDQITDPHADSDGDGHTDGEEVYAGTDWTDPDSVLTIERMTLVGGQVDLSWPGVAGVRYRVCGKQNLNDGAWIDLSEDILGQGGPARWSGVMDRTSGRWFYAIRVVTDGQSL